MLLMGGEARRSQGGNNNAYCQDNETSWFDWRLVDEHADVHRFVSLLNARRLLRDVEHERRRISLCQWIERANKAWHGVEIGQPDEHVFVCKRSVGPRVENGRRDPHERAPQLGDGGG